MYAKGQEITARGRTWVVEIPGEGDVDMLIAVPLFTDEERARMQRVDKVNDLKKTVIPHGVSIQRDVLDYDEIAA